MQRLFEGVFFNIFWDLISESALDWVTNDSQVVLESIYEGVELMISLPNQTGWAPGFRSFMSLHVEARLYP